VCSAAARAADGAPTAVQDVGIDHCRAQVLVAQEVLDSPDVVPVLEQMGCKGVPEGVAGSRLGQARPAGSFLNSYMRAG